MLRQSLPLVFILLASSAVCSAQHQPNDRISWQELFEIGDLPAGPTRQARIADFGYKRDPNKSLEWNRDLHQIISNQPYEWTESVVLVRDKPNIIRYITTFSTEFRRMITLLKKPASSTLGDDDGVGAIQLPSRESSGGQIVEQYRKEDVLIEVMSFRDRSGLENWVFQITKGAY